MKQIFSSPNIRIRMHGDEVLSLVTSDKDDHLSYQLLGFHSPKILLYDYRSQRNAGLEHFIKTGDPKQFISSFCSKAKVSVYKNQAYHVVLEDAEAGNSDMMLWMATGLKGSIPAYDFYICELAPFENHGFSIFSIFIVPDQETLVDLDYFEQADEHSNYQSSHEYIQKQEYRLKHAQY